MIRDILFSRNLNWLKTLAVILLGMAALVLLFQQYGFSFSTAWIDVSVHFVLVLAGMGLLEKIFRFYVPNSSNWWFVFVLSIFGAVAVTYLAQYALQMLIAGNGEYMHMLVYSLPIRLMVIILFFLAWSGILVFNSKVEDQLKTKERQEKISQMAKEAELFHLKQQLQPHFLFNSLNSISALVKSQPDKAREMILQLADFLRGTIRKDDRKWLSVEEEKNYLDLYLEIEKVRFGHRLSVHFGVSGDALPLKLPPLMVQPLLENAVKHGLYGLIGEVAIKLHFEKSGGDLLVSVSNPYDPAMSSKPTGEGFGLESVRRRLYLLFGRNDLLLTKSIENEFLVTLKIPQYHVQSSHSG